MIMITDVLHLPSASHCILSISVCHPFIIFHTISHILDGLLLIRLFIFPCWKKYKTFHSVPFLLVIVPDINIVLYFDLLKFSFRIDIWHTTKKEKIEINIKKEFDRFWRQYCVHSLFGGYQFRVTAVKSPV
jgi:hypothetical protein